MVTSCVLPSRAVGLRRGRDQEALTVEQRAKVVQRGHRNTRSTFLGEWLTGQRIQHPGRDGHLHVISEPDDHAISGVAPEPTDDLYGFAVKRMVTVVNGGWGWA